MRHSHEMGDWKIQLLQVNGNGQPIPLTPDLWMKEQRPIQEASTVMHNQALGVMVAHEDLGVLYEAKPRFSV